MAIHVVKEDPLRRHTAPIVFQIWTDCESETEEDGRILACNQDKTIALLEAKQELMNDVQEIEQLLLKESNHLSREEDQP